MLLTKCSVLCLFIAACWTVCAGNHELLDKEKSDLLDPVLVSSDGKIPSAKRIIRQPPGVLRSRGKDGRYIYRKMGVSIEATPGVRVVRAYPERRGYKINKPKPTSGYLYTTTKPTKRGYVYTTPKPTRPPPIGIESTEENDSQFVTPDPPPDSVSPDKDFLPNKPIDDDGFDIRDSIPGTPGVDYKVYGSVPDTNFTCEGKTPGFYADPEAGCQVFHRCSDDPWYSGQYRVNMDSFLCPNGSLFNQQIYTCDWWGNVDCKGSEQFYELNEQIGQLEETSLGTIQYVQFSGARVPPPPGKKRKAPAIIPKNRREPLPDEYRSHEGEEGRGNKRSSKGNKQSAVGFDSKDFEEDFRPYVADEDDPPDEEGSSQNIKEVRAKAPVTTRKPANKRSEQTTRRPKPKPRQTTTESSKTRTVAYREDNIIPAAQEVDPFIVNNDRDGPVTDSPFDGIPPTAEFDEGGNNNNNDVGNNDGVAADPADDNVPPADADAGLDNVAPADPAGDNVPPINDEFPSPDPGGINAAGADPKEDEDDLSYVPPTSAGVAPSPEQVTTIRTTSRTSTTPATKKTTVASGAGGYPGSKGKGGYSGSGNRGGYSNSNGQKGGYSGGGNGNGGYSGGRGGGYAGNGGYKTSATNRYPAPTRGYSYPKPNKPTDDYLPPQNSVTEGREARQNTDDFLTPPNREPLGNENSNNNDEQDGNFLPRDAKAELNSYVPPKDTYLPPNNKPDNNYLPPNQNNNGYLPPKNDYGLPNQNHNGYLPPKTDYGLPNQNQNGYLPPKSDYGLPNQNQNGYLPPKSDYGLPNQNQNGYLPPKTDYGLPNQNHNGYLPPKSDYGLPNQNHNGYLPPKSDYGLPNQNHNGYLPPKSDYGLPNQNHNGYLPPKSDYGLPNQNHNGYLPPKTDYGLPNQNHNGYLPPKSDYGLPNQNQNGYLPPKTPGYLPPPTQDPLNTYSETPDSYFRKPSTGYGAPVTPSYGPPTTVTEPSVTYGQVTETYLPPAVTEPTNLYLPVTPSQGYQHGPGITAPGESYGLPSPSNEYLPQPTSSPYNNEYLTIPIKEYGTPQNGYNPPRPDESRAAQQQNNEYIPVPPTEFTTPRHDYLPSKPSSEEFRPQNSQNDNYLAPPPNDKEFEYAIPQNDFTTEFRLPRNHETYAPQMRYQDIPQFAALRQNFRAFNPQPPSQFLTEASTYRSTPYRYHSVAPPKIEFFTAPLVSYSHVVNPLNRNSNDNFFTKKK